MGFLGFGGDDSAPEQDDYTRQMIQTIGPMPKNPGSYRILGFPLNPEASGRYEMEKAAWVDRAKTFNDMKMAEMMHPLRGAGPGQISSLTGYALEDIADPSQIKTRTVDAPGPYQEAMQFTAEGPRPQGVRLIPRHVDLQGPGEPQLTRFGEAAMLGINNGDVSDGSPLMRDYALRHPSMYSEGPRPRGITYHEEPVELQGPGQPLNPQSYIRPSTVQAEERYIDPEAKSTLLQQMLGSSALKREETWPRSIPHAPGAAQESLLREKVAQLEAIGIPREAAIANVYAGEPLPGLTKDRNWQARTRSSQSRADNLDADTSLKNKKVDRFDEAADDKHEDTQSRIADRAFNQDFKNRSLALRERLHQANQKAIQNKDILAWERLNEIRHWHDTIIAKLEAVDKPDIRSDEEQAAYKKALDILTGLTERPATDEELGFFEKLFGVKPRFEAQGAIRPPLQGSTNATPSPAPSRQSPGTSQAPAQSSQSSDEFAGAPPGKNVDDKLKVNGKPVARWDGKQWQKLTTP